MPFLRTAFDEMWGQFSPGPEGHPRWIAYTSNESGHDQVFVRAFPDSGEKWLVSAESWSLPRWRGDGKKLYYVSTDGKLMLIPVRQKGKGPEFGTPHPLFPFAPFVGVSAGYMYDVTADGQRFLLLQPTEESAPKGLTVAYN